MTDKRNKEFIRRHIGPSSDEQKKNVIIFRIRIFR